MSGWRGGWWRLGLACRIVVVWRGLARCVEVMWQGLGMCWVRVADGVGAGGSWALCAALRWRGGSAGSWRAMLGRRGLACRVGVARWVGSGRVSGQDGGGSRAQMACNIQGFACCVGGQVGGGSVLRTMSGWRVGAGTNGSGSCAQGDSNGLQR
ncbi:hypothetical protein EDB83DRAFT_2322586 [Lactarius deliciosus]|nr:hypothetical protein EDB83DRAFT_2322586 [Lactarius deliciosus]